MQAPRPGLPPPPQPPQPHPPPLPSERKSEEPSNTETRPRPSSARLTMLSTFGGLESASLALELLAGSCCKKPKKKKTHTKKGEC